MKIKKGFSIIELLIVLAVSSLISLSALYAYQVYSNKSVVRKEVDAVLRATQNIRDAYFISQDYYSSYLNNDIAKFYPSNMVDSEGNVKSHLIRNKSNAEISISADNYPISGFSPQAKGKAFTFHYPNVNPKYCLGFIKGIEPSFDYIGSRYGGIIKSPDRGFELKRAISVCGGEDEHGHRFPNLYFSTK